MSGIFISIMSGIVIMLVKRGWAKKDKEEKMMNDILDKIDDLSKSIWKLKKTTLIMAKVLDEQTEKEHPTLNSNLEDIASELLDDSNKS